MSKNTNRSISSKKNSRSIKASKKRSGGSSGVASVVQLRAQRLGGRIAKTQKGSSCRRGTEINASSVQDAKGFALVSSASGQITLRQIQSCGLYLKRFAKKRAGKVVRKISAYVPMTKKPAEVRMGKGKGSKIDREVYPIRAGKIIFELVNFNFSLARHHLKFVASRIGIRTRITKLRR